MGKKGKLRPFRVDYFDVHEMTDGDLALVRSVVVRTVTKKEAKASVIADGFDTSRDDRARFIINCERFYKKLSAQPKKKVYRSVEQLFGEKKALKVMDQIEQCKPVIVITPEMLKPPVVIDPGPNAWSGGLKIPLPAPTSGPDSPDTQKAVADLTGFISGDKHEQVMDTFVASTPIPEGHRFPNPDTFDLDAAAPIVNPAPEHGDEIAAALTAVEVNTNFGLPPYEWCPKHPRHYKLNCTACKLEAEDAAYVAGSSRAEPTTDWVLANNAEPLRFKDSLPLPTWAKLAMFGGITALVLVIILAILHCPK
jgi:hypothetical protein